MEKRILNVLIFTLLFLSFKAQFTPTVETISPYGIFDKVYDRFGTRYDLANLNIASGKPIGGTFSTSTVPTASCDAGYFTLFFAPGSTFETNVQVQTLICQVFTDISHFIHRP